MNLRPAASKLHLFYALFAVALLGSSVALAQTTTLQPDESAKEGTALVRLVHVAPNLPAATVTLTSRGDNAETFTPDAFSNLSYGSATDYIELPAGDYWLTISGEGLQVLQKDVGFRKDNHHTLTLCGLVLPDAGAQADEETDFVDWLRRLFGGEQDDALALRVGAYDDDVSQVASDQQRVRVIDAAPAASDFDLVAIENDGSAEVVAGGLSFTDASDFVTLDAGVTGLELRVAGSAKTVIDLSDTLARGSAQTVIITGTEFEGLPLEALTLEDAQLPR